jgi:hypothetical protein
MVLMLDLEAGRFFARARQAVLIAIGSFAANYPYKIVRMSIHGSFPTEKQVGENYSIISSLVTSLLMTSVHQESGRRRLDNLFPHIRFVFDCQGSLFVCII